MELTTDFKDDGAGSAGYRVDQQTGEQEHDGCSDEQTKQVLWVTNIQDAEVLQALVLAQGLILSLRDVGVLDCLLHSIREGTKQCRCCKNSSSNRDALGDGLRGVTHSVEAGEDGSAFLVHVA